MGRGSLGACAKRRFASLSLSIKSFPLSTAFTNRRPQRTPKQLRWNDRVNGRRSISRAPRSPRTIGHVRAHQQSSRFYGESKCSRADTEPCRRGRIRAEPIWNSPLDNTSHKTRVVGDLQLCAAGTAQHMSTQRRGAALFDGRHDLQLSQAQRYSLSPRWPVDAEDVRDLQHGALRAVLA
jgi:hypothetical protein